MLDIGAYLKRINYNGPLEPSEQVLFDLHLAHLLAVPFENLSIHSGEQILLSEEALFNKIVVNGRGGFCYELNGLFAALLKQIGFNVSILSAGVKNEKGEFSPDFDHMTLMVVLNERWLADVGFGDSFRNPLRLDSTQVQHDGNRLYRIAENGSYLMMMEKRIDSEWKEMYRFKLDSYGYDDFNEMCRYHQTSPESHFTQRIICSLAKPDGRITISSNRLLITKEEDKQEKELASDEEVKAVLDEHFNIRLNNLKSIVN